MNTKQETGTRQPSASFGKRRRMLSAIVQNRPGLLAAWETGYPVLVVSGRLVSELSRPPPWVACYSLFLNLCNPRRFDHV
jgi:hypothetical protein